MVAVRCCFDRALRDIIFIPGYGGTAEAGCPALRQHVAVSAASQHPIYCGPTLVHNAVVTKPTSVSACNPAMCVEQYTL